MGVMYTLYAYGLERADCQVGECKIVTDEARLRNPENDLLLISSLKDPILLSSYRQKINWPQGWRQANGRVRLELPLGTSQGLSVRSWFSTVSVSH